ncbi:hypothetical protein EAE99_000371 [Botrytis elliptica]|nr:hypothetical protein EAE99_000371 [Botrytis elliptica]
MIRGFDPAFPTRWILEVIWIVPPDDIWIEFSSIILLRRTLHIFTCLSTYFGCFRSFTMEGPLSNAGLRLWDYQLSQRRGQNLILIVTSDECVVWFDDQAHSRRREPFNTYKPESEALIDINSRFLISNFPCKTSRWMVRDMNDRMWLRNIKIGSLGKFEGQKIYRCYLCSGATDLALHNPANSRNGILLAETAVFYSQKYSILLFAVPRSLKPQQSFTLYGGHLVGSATQMLDGDWIAPPMKLKDIWRGIPN